MRRRYIREEGSATGFVALRLRLDNSSPDNQKPMPLLTTLVPWLADQLTPRGYRKLNWVMRRRGATAMRDERGHSVVMIEGISVPPEPLAPGVARTQAAASAFDKGRT